MIIFKDFFKNEYVELIFVIFLILLVRFFVLEPFRIPTGSMKPTLLVGDFVFANKFIYSLKLPFFNNYFYIKTPIRGDIVIFFKDNIRYIKRVVGIPYDILYYKNKTLFLNNIKIKKKKIFCKIRSNFDKCIAIEYLNSKREYIIKFSKDYKQNNNDSLYILKKIIKDNYFVMGDNRDNSHDSRFFGSISKYMIKGKAIFIWLSFDISIIDLRWHRFFKIL